MGVYKNLNSRKTLQKKKKTNGGITFPHFTLYYKGIVVKTMCYQNNMAIRNNGTEYELIESFQKWKSRTGQLFCRKMKLDHQLTPHTKTDSTWIKNHEVRSETVKKHRRTYSWNITEYSHPSCIQKQPTMGKGNKATLSKWGKIILKIFLHIKRIQLVFP